MRIGKTPGAVYGKVLYGAPLDRAASDDHRRLLAVGDFVTNLRITN